MNSSSFHHKSQSCLYQRKSPVLFGTIITLTLCMLLQPCLAQYYPGSYYGYYAKNFNGGGFSPYYNNYYGYGKAY